MFIFTVATLKLYKSPALLGGDLFKNDNQLLPYTHFESRKKKTSNDRSAKLGLFAFHLNDLVVYATATTGYCQFVP